MTISKGREKLDTSTRREKLKLRAEPYWVPVSEGCSLGYKKKRRNGIWLVRRYHRHARPSSRQIRLGLADDAADADGIRVLTYHHALNLAKRWCADEMARIQGGQPRSTYRVSDAMKDYLQNCTRRGYRSVANTRRMIEFHVLPVIGHLLVEDLTREDVRQWIQSLLEFKGRLRPARGGMASYENVPSSSEVMRRRMHTANRILQIFKAALNFVLEEGHVKGTDFAWRGVQGFRIDPGGRFRYLSPDDQKMFVAACEGDFRRLVMGALYTGARPKELTNLRVENFLGTGIFVPGVIAKTNQPRTIVLEESAQSFFYTLVAKRAPQELIFSQSGKPWTLSDMWRYARAACEKAELSEMTFYALRHSAAGNWLRAGVPIKHVAEQLGHSVLVCERHYAHIGPARRAELFANLPKSCISGMEEFQLLAAYEKICARGGSSSTLGAGAGATLAEEFPQDRRANGP
jgi:integrase